MKIKNEYIQTAIDALTQSAIVVNEQYNSVFKGYISGLGASIIQAGLLPSVILYENSPSSKDDKGKVIDAIVYMLVHQFQYIELKDTSLSNYIISEHLNGNEYKLLLDINEALVAIKLALRMFNSQED